MSKKLPQGWTECKFKDLFDLKQGKNLSLSELVDSGYSVFGANGKIGYYDEYMYDEKVLLVTCRGATCGSINITEEKSWVTGNSIALIPKVDLDINFYKFYLKYISFIDVISGSAQPQIIVSKLNEKKIIYVPLEEQERMVSILERAERAIQKRKESNMLLDELVKSKFVEMFGNSEDATATELEKTCIKITDGTHQSPKFVSEGIPFLFVSNIVNNKIDYTTNRFISRDEYAVLIKRTPIEIGDILLTSVGSYGNPAVVESTKEFCFQRHIAYIKPNEEYINSYYLHSVLQTPYVRRQIDRKVRGIAQKTLNLSELKKIRINIPKLGKQKEFENFYLKVDRLKLSMENSLKELENNFNSLMQRAFNGELH